MLTPTPGMMPALMSGPCDGHLDLATAVILAAPQGDSVRDLFDRICESWSSSELWCAGRKIVSKSGKWDKRGADPLKSLAFSAPSYLEYSDPKGLHLSDF